MVTIRMLASREHARAARRVVEASGYLELGMAQQAIGRLEGITSLGPLEGAVQYVRGQALRMLSRYDEAAVPLQAAALLMPPPLARHVWLALSESYSAAGREALAAQSLAIAQAGIEGEECV
jgi:predicted Zn-dependent protease